MPELHALRKPPLTETRWLSYPLLAHCRRNLVHRTCPVMIKADMDRHRVSVSGGFRKACSSGIPPHQNRLVFRPACSPSRDGSRVEPASSRRRCKQSVAVKQWQSSCDACGTQAPRWPTSTQVQAQRPSQRVRLFSSRSSKHFCKAMPSSH